MDVASVLANYSIHILQKDLPNAVISQSKTLILDQISLMAAGMTTHREDGPDIFEYLRTLGGTPQASLLGTDDKTAVERAAFANAYIAASAGFDSVHKATVIHLLPVLIPAALAVAEHRRTNGARFLNAFVAGAEVMARVGLALGSRGVYARGFHPTSICGPIGCAVTAGLLLDLEAEALAHAIRIAAAYAAGSSVWAGARLPESFGIQIGHAAENGVAAALLAQAGFRGTLHLFEDPRGFLAAHSDTADVALLANDLDEHFEIMNISLKRFSVSDPNKTAVEALLELMDKHDLDGADIESIEVILPTTVVPLYGSVEYPINRGGTRVNTRYIIAAGAFFGRSMTYSLAFAGPDTRADPGVRGLFSRISVAGDSKLDQSFPQKKPSIVRILTRDGRRVAQHRETAAKGDPENPLKWQDIVEKTHSLADDILGAERVDMAIKCIADLDRLRDVGDIFTTLTQCRLSE